MSNVYSIKNSIIIGNVFSDTDTGDPYDPDEVTLYIMKPDNSLITLVYPDGITKNGTGDYQSIELAKMSGQWNYQWYGVTDKDTDDEKSTTSPETIFEIEPSSLIAG